MSGDDYTGLASLAAGFVLDRRRRRHAVALAATRRPALVALHPSCRTHRRRGVRSDGNPRSGRDFLRRHARGTAVRSGCRPGRAVRGGRVHDQRRPAAEGLVHPLAQRRRRDLVPGPSGVAEAREDARRQRVRRAASTGAAKASEGDPNIFGWQGERDIHAAVEFLQNCPDVDPERIGGIGLSVGGEMMIEAAAESTALKAIVSEGAAGVLSATTSRTPAASGRTWSA